MLFRPFVLSLAILPLGIAAALTFAGSSSSSPSLPDPAVNPPTSGAQRQTAVLAGGCFWGMEAVFEHLKGVSEVVTGFSGGSAATANYEMVSAGDTEHAEAVQITYDPSQISYAQLLKVYFSVAHDPTQLNRQGPDQGPAYRSAIFFANDEQRQVAQAYVAQLNKAQVFRSPVVTQLAPLNGFYAAEPYHQNFVARNPNNPYVIVHDRPQLKQLKQQFPDLHKP
ncbi:peptide-methionine (S)-S-oxide reductase MsrA [Leptolyngbya sp. FACHB-261]|nr:peptide-methionine (S)-S-oxide reductase MsrA [Leptolyngbya sp. FACHB-261]